MSGCEFARQKLGVVHVAVDVAATMAAAATF